MDCYFASSTLPSEGEPEKNAIVGFHIPDLGIRFKAPFEGVDTDHCDFAALLALLEFIDSNQKYFSKHTYQIFGNNLRVVNQVNRKEPSPPEFAPLIEKAMIYRDKYRFTLEWVSVGDNSAF